MAVSVHASPVASTFTTSTTPVSVTPQASGAPVQLLPQTVQGPNANALAKTPSNLASTTKSFLDTYQPRSSVASDFIGPKNGAHFSSAGYCFAEYPCFSVNQGAMASIGTKAEVTAEQMSALLDSVLTQDHVTFDHSTMTSMLSGFKTTKNGATLEIVAPAGTMSSSVVAGMAFDMFKLQSNNAQTNSIRAVQTPSDGHPAPIMALCVYPDQGSDTTHLTAIQNFCVGKELDGSVAPASQRMTKRDFSIGALLGDVCSVIDLPILCPSKGG